MFLIDTNVVSELRKGKKANDGVRAFWQRTDPVALFISVVTIGELRRGVENLRARGDLPQARQLEAWLDEVLTDYAERILDFDRDCAQIWGKLMSPHAQHPLDKQIAAIALLYDLTVVTRNTADYAGTGVKLLNPFSS
ncbi:MAG: type II toxin-antitoxin system VapC family toxin [Rhodocyclaceae bacterium]|nr:type II toxin-antitoxin system VapC family toxin [Rhodocyclaceae bacterium]